MSNNNTYVEYYTNKLSDTIKEYDNCQEEIYLYNVRLDFEKNIDFYENLFSFYQNSLEKVDYYKSEIDVLKDEISMVEKRISTLEKQLKHEETRNALIKIFNAKKRDELKSLIQSDNDKLHNVYQKKNIYSDSLRKDKSSIKALEKVLDNLSNHYGLSREKLIKVINMDCDNEKLSSLEQQNMLRYNDIKNYLKLISERHEDRVIIDNEKEFQFVKKK